MLLTANSVFPTESTVSDYNKIVSWLLDSGFVQDCKCHRVSVKLVIQPCAPLCVECFGVRFIRQVYFQRYSKYCKNRSDKASSFCLYPAAVKAVSNVC